MIEGPIFGQDTDEITVNEDLDQPPHDEIGVADNQLNTCPECEQLYPADGWHYCAENTIGDVPEPILDG